MYGMEKHILEKNVISIDVLTLITNEKGFGNVMELKLHQRNMRNFLNSKMEFVLFVVELIKVARHWLLTTDIQMGRLGGYYVLGVIHILNRLNCGNGLKTLRNI